jgi:hypothetical protein
MWVEMLKIMIGHLNQNLALAIIFYTLLPFAALTLKIILFLKMLKILIFFSINKYL